MELTVDEVTEIEVHLKHGNKAHIFFPRGVGNWPHDKYTVEEYLDWLKEHYPTTVFVETNTQLSHSLDARITKYLDTKWLYRNTSDGQLRRELTALQKEILPLRKIKQTLVCLKQAQVQMDKLNI